MAEAYLSNAVLASKVDNLVQRWSVREDQYKAWAGGAANGGPYGDGIFPLTDDEGVTHLVESPAKLSALVMEPAGAVQETYAATLVAQEATEAAQVVAEIRASQADASKTVALDARDLALLYRDDAAADKAATASHREAVEAIVGDFPTAIDSARDRSTHTGVQLADTVEFPDPHAPAYLKTISDIISGLPVSIMRFVPKDKILGIIARTNSDNLQPYFAEALASGLRELICPPGLYNVDSAIAMHTGSQLLKGSGETASEIRIRSTTASAITLENGVAGYGLKGFKISRTGTPVAGATGVKFLGTTDASELERLVIEGHWDGLLIGTCDTGHIKKLRVSKCLNDGVRQTNASTYGPSQWDVDDVLVNRNVRDGWRIETTDGPPGLILGQMRNLRSFANTGWGLLLLGTSTTGIYDLRLSDAFMGSDGLGSVKLDTYGGKHRLSGFFERNGRDPTGPDVSTPASGIGVGIDASGANTDLIVYGSTIDDNAYDGIVHGNCLLTVGASNIYNNGQALATGRRNGILSYSGELVAGVGAVNNIGANVSQLYGIAAGHDNVTVVGLTMKTNVTAATTLGSLTNAVLMGNAGTPVHRIPSGHSLSVGNPSGTTAGGGINVAGDVQKNGTNYAHP